MPNFLAVGIIAREEQKHWLINTGSDVVSVAGCSGWHGGMVCSSETDASGRFTYMEDVVSLALSRPLLPAGFEQICLGSDGGFWPVRC